MPFMVHLLFEQLLESNPLTVGTRSDCCSPGGPGGSNLGPGLHHLTQEVIPILRIPEISPTILKSQGIGKFLRIRPLICTMDS